MSLMSPALAGRSFTTSTTWEAHLEQPQKLTLQTFQHLTPDSTHFCWEASAKASCFSREMPNRLATFSEVILEHGWGTRSLCAAWGCRHQGHWQEATWLGLRAPTRDQHPGGRGWGATRPGQLLRLEGNCFPVRRRGLPGPHGKATSSFLLPGPAASPHPRAPAGPLAQASLREASLGDGPRCGGSRVSPHTPCGARTPCPRPRGGPGCSAQRLCDSGAFEAAL